MAGTYLLDTAALIYLMSQEESVPVPVRRELADPKSEVFYSQISIWEIQMKHQLGKLPMSDEPAVVLPRELPRYGFTRCGDLRAFPPSARAQGSIRPNSHRSG
jgi:PIN domain nuclease of toxin-antitoxin system